MGPKALSSDRSGLCFIRKSHGPASNVRNTMRNKGIDVLRAIAVFLVLGRHAHFPRNPITDVWVRGGWVGVDLFFVLSGFLVSGILFREYEKCGTIRWTRFVARRGFKIYPAFYALLALVLIFNAATGTAPFEWNRTLSEAFFVQNYGAALWGHTWSLAVEEHFYLLLPILLAASARDRFRGLPAVVGVTAICLLALRCFGGEFQVQKSVFATHLRLDSLLFGTFLAYLCHMKPKLFEKITTYRLPLAMFGIAARALGVCLFPQPLEETPRDLHLWLHAVLPGKWGDPAGFGQRRPDKSNNRGVGKEIRDVLVPDLSVSRRRGRLACAPGNLAARRMLFRVWRGDWRLDVKIDRNPHAETSRETSGGRVNREGSTEK